MRAADTFQRIDDRQMNWQGPDGRIHLCEGADVHRGVRLIWTLCCRSDVPGGEAYLPGRDDPPVTCIECLREERDIREGA